MVEQTLTSYPLPIKGERLRPPPRFAHPLLSAIVASLRFRGRLWGGEEGGGDSFRVSGEEVSSFVGGATLEGSGGSIVVVIRGGVAWWEKR